MSVLSSYRPCRKFLSCFAALLLCGGIISVKAAKAERKLNFQAVVRALIIQQRQPPRFAKAGTS